MGFRIGARYRSLVRDDGGGFAGAVARLRFDFQTAGGMRPRSRGSMRPRFASISPTFGEEGAGKAGCRLHPMGPVQRKHGSRTTGEPETARLSLRDGLRLT